jgi:hypothetical protein
VVHIVFPTSADVTKLTSYNDVWYSEGFTDYLLGVNSLASILWALALFYTCSLAAPSNTELLLPSWKRHHSKAGFTRAQGPCCLLPYHNMAWQSRYIVHSCLPAEGPDAKVLQSGGQASQPEPSLDKNTQNRNGRKANQ